jgi:hypothetical protein
MIFYDLIKKFFQIYQLKKKEQKSRTNSFILSVDEDPFLFIYFKEGKE